MGSYPICNIIAYDEVNRVHDIVNYYQVLNDFFLSLLREPHMLSYIYVYIYLYYFILVKSLYPINKIR